MSSATATAANTISLLNSSNATRSSSSSPSPPTPPLTYHLRNRHESCSKSQMISSHSSSTSTTAVASTIYHSPQSSPRLNESSPPPPTMLVQDVAQVHDEEDIDRPLDFSSKSSKSNAAVADLSSPIKKIAEIIQTEQRRQETESSSSSSSRIHHPKKVHPKFLASKQHHQTAEHCFTTPSPSPPENRINDNAKNINGLLPFQQAAMMMDPQNSAQMFGKFFQEMNNSQSNITSSSLSPPPSALHPTSTAALLNETLLNKALQIAKMTSANNCTTIPGPMMVDSFNTNDIHSSAVDQQQTTAHLIKLLSQVHQNMNPTANLPSINDLLLNNNNNNNNPLCPNKPMMPIFPTSHQSHAQHSSSSPILPSPPQQHVSAFHDPNRLISPRSNNHRPSVILDSKNSMMNGGGLLTTATSAVATPTSPTNILQTMLIDKNHNHHRTSPSIAETTTSSSTTTTTAASNKYTRPFNKFYKNKDLSGLLQTSTPNNKNSQDTSNSSSSLPIESLATQSLLNSEQAYQAFRQQMLSNKQNTPGTNGGGSKQKNANRKSSSSLQMNGNSCSSLSNDSSHHSDDGSSNSSFNGVNAGGSSMELMANLQGPIIASPSAIPVNALNGNSQPATAAIPASSSSPASIRIASTTSQRKRGRPLPDEMKDEAYWERRRKNNEAAKRSRDLRRAKEDEIAMRACFLEQENRQLTYELIQTRLELDKVKSLLTTLQQQQSKSGSEEF